MSRVVIASVWSVQKVDDEEVESPAEARGTDESPGVDEGSATGRRVSQATVSVAL